MLRDEEGRDNEQQRRWEMIREQRPPVTTDGSGPAVWDLVIEDMRQRNADGTAKYGTPLRTFNGRDPLTDLYQELLDAVVYCRQEKARRDKLREQDGYTLTVLVAERDEARRIVQSLTAERDDLAKHLADARAGLVAVTEERDGWKDDHERMMAVCEANSDDCLKAREQRDAAFRERDEARKELSRVKAERDEANRVVKERNALRFQRDELIEEQSRLRELSHKQGEAIGKLKDELAAFRKVVQVLQDPPF